MERMRMFLIYALMIFGFIVYSYLMENALIYQMYKHISGTVDNNFSVSGVISSNFETNVIEAKASNVSGYIRLTVKNTTNSFLDVCYVKVNLTTKLGLQAATKYYELQDFDINEERHINIKFKADEITDYLISFENTAPDKTYILNFFGWEVDIRDVFGMDLSRFIDTDNLKTTGITMWDWCISIVKSVPWWGYMIAGWIVVWNLPARFLFGIFPL